MIVSVGHYHHDYPAADIAAPEGAPLYALTDGFIVDAWHVPTGNCGIGLTMRAALDGRLWTYCHMSYEQPGMSRMSQSRQPVGLDPGLLIRHVANVTPQAAVESRAHGRPIPQFPVAMCHA